MPVALHVSGPALLWIGPMSETGFAGALEQLGIAEDGVTIQFSPTTNPVMTDAAGPHKPADLQDMGEDATIQVPLSAYDVDVAKKLRKRGNSTGEGISGSMGRLIATNAHHWRLVIESESDEHWRFYTTYLTNPQSLRLGTRYTVAHLNFYAWCFVGAYNTAKGKLWYDHVKG